MKLKSIQFTGYHTEQTKKYDFGDITYFYGANGRGKSTILQAIQLGLLGYLPGEAKNSNTVIWKHVVGPVLEITLTLDNDVKIFRRWFKQGNSVKAECQVFPETINIKDILEDFKDTELPIFNYSDFLELSANKMKDWFIEFLPEESSARLDWKNILETTASSITPIVIDTDLIPNARKEILGLGKSGIEEIRGANTYFKSLQSFIKSELQRLTNTIQSLIYYDDFDADTSESDLRIKLGALSDEKTKLIKVIQTCKANITLMAELEKLPSDNQISKKLAELNESIEAYNELMSKRDYDNQIKAITSEIADIKAEISSLTKIKQSNGMCPYTKEMCNTLSTMLPTDEKLQELADNQKSLETKYAGVLKERKDLSDQISDAKSQLNKVEAISDKRTMLSSRIIPTEFTLEEYSQQLSEVEANIEAVTDTLTKCIANNKYQTLMSSYNKDKARLEQNQELVKAFVKKTDVNGLQSDFLTKGDNPFKRLQVEMDRYINIFFGTNTSTQFNLEGGANSFSFGINKADGDYLSYIQLSSGEKCMFTIALMIALLTISGNSKILVLDDIFDHLDSYNLDLVFAKLPELSDVQIIAAGVNYSESLIPYRVDI